MAIAHAFLFTHRSGILERWPAHSSSLARATRAPLRWERDRRVSWSPPALCPCPCQKRPRHATDRPYWNGWNCISRQFWRIAFLCRCPDRPVSKWSVHCSKPESVQCKSWMRVKLFCFWFFFFGACIISSRRKSFMFHENRGLLLPFLYAIAATPWLLATNLHRNHVHTFVCICNCNCKYVK